MNNLDWLEDLLRNRGQVGQESPSQQRQDEIAAAIVQAALQEVGKFPDDVVPFPRPLKRTS